MENKKTLCWLSLGAGLGLIAASTLFMTSKKADRPASSGKLRELLDEADRLLLRLRGSSRQRRRHQS